jgi:transcriptional regulator with XRE-family HTH domain
MIAQFFFMSFQKAVGSCIYELRERMGLTLEQLAERSGLSSSRLTAIEHGEVDIKLGTLLLLAMSLDVTLPELFGCIAGKVGISKEPPKGLLIAFPKLSKAQTKL